MQRSFLSRIIICLIPTLLATAMVVWAYSKDPVNYTGFRRGIDLSGGTILVYEVDQTLSKESRGIDDTGSRAVADYALAEAIKRRIDDKDLLNVIVRPLGTTRVEIIMPFGAPTKDGKGTQGQNEVEDIKRRINEVGSLEFRVHGLRSLTACPSRDARGSPSRPHRSSAPCTTPARTRRCCRYAALPAR